MRVRRTVGLLAFMGGQAALWLAGPLAPARAALPDSSMTASSAPLTAVLSGANETGGGDPDGSGLAAVTVDATNNLVCYELSKVNNLDPPTAAHIHKAAAGTNGPVVQALTAPSTGTGDDSSRACVTPSDSTLIAGLMANPADYYVNVHTGTFPNGAIRGQLAATASRSVGAMSGMLEQSSGVNNLGDPDGAGRAIVWVNTDQSTVCVRLSFTGIDAPTAAHIHKAAAGANGPIVVALDTPDDGFSFNCATAGGSDVAALASDPKGYYVNVHNAAFPGGALRGQLMKAGAGYRLAGSDGGVFAFGQGDYRGSRGGSINNASFVATATTPTREGYWLASADGDVFNFGDAGLFGTATSVKLNKPVVGMATTPTGKGYWLVASDGGVFSFGDAAFKGSTGAMTLNQPIVGIVATPTGKGYWLVASDGGVFSFGDAGFFGSTGSMKLNKPVVGMAATPLGKGYWLVASDGGVFTFGDGAFFGSTGAMKLNQPVVTMLSSPSGAGYLLVASDGGVFTFGNAEFAGSTGSLKLNAPIVAATV